MSGVAIYLEKSLQMKFSPKKTGFQFVSTAETDQTRKIAAKVISLSAQTDQTRKIDAKVISLSAQQTLIRQER